VSWYHTARDPGRPGPDYVFGYGLVEAHAAIDAICNRVVSQIDVIGEVVMRAMRWRRAGRRINLEVAPLLIPP
jgi:hypothetical protein